MHHPIPANNGGGWLFAFIYTLQPGNYNYRRFEFNFTPKKSFFSSRNNNGARFRPQEMSSLYYCCVWIFHQRDDIYFFSHIDSFTTVFSFLSQKTQRGSLMM